MRLLASTVAVLAAGALTLAPQSPPAPPERYVVPGDRAFPTGVAHDPSSGRFYVGSAEDGTIQRGHVDEPRTEVWSPDGTDGRSFTSALALDGAGHLYVNGGPTSTLRVYDPDDATLLATLKGKPGGFVNDVAPVSGKVAYVTDSFKPVIYRVARSGDRWTMRPWLDVRAAGIDWVDGEHNLNGIISVGRHLLAVQSNTGQLWRIDPASREVVEVDLGDELLRNGDGLAWRDGRLYVAQGNLFDAPGAEARVAVVALDADLASGRVVDGLTPPEGLQHPSAIALTDGEDPRLLVVNSQFDRWSAGLPPRTLPFTIASLRLPEEGADG
ncbi:SMP-30/gluconolactonase/LRE family protein [Streptomyces albidoflavus]